MTRKYTYLIFGILAGASLGFAKIPLASEEVLHFEASRAQVAVGQSVALAVMVDSSQLINAYSFGITYPADGFDLVNLNNANSIIDVWQGNPVVSDGGHIKFIGGSLKAFSGERGLLHIVNLRAKVAGSFKIDFDNQSFVYLANGKGTRQEPTTRSLTLEVVDNGSPPVEEATPEDSTPPKINFLDFVPDPVTPSQKLVSFMVGDDLSGIKKTTLRAKSWFWWGDEKVVTNPISVPKSIWAVMFRVVDNAGNASESTIYDWGAFLRYLLPILIVSLGIIALVINRVFKRKIGIIK